MTDAAPDPWNHNTHYLPLLLRALPAPCHRALDLGCGQGFLLPGLAARAGLVVGIDQDEPSLVEAADRVAGLANVHLLKADVMTHHFDEPFDAVLSVAVLHHLPLEAGLARMAELTTPGGVVGVIGLARSRSLGDYAMDAVGVVETRVQRWRRGHTPVTAPLADPQHTYAEVRDAAGRVLPGARVRRHPLFRYSMIRTTPPR